jgi:putative addiction module CopG family antidote
MKAKASAKRSRAIAGRVDMSVEIPPSYSSVVERLIAEGKFRNEEEVVAEGLRLIVLRDKLDQDIQAGIDELEAGDRMEASQVYAEARRRIKSADDQPGK